MEHTVSLTHQRSKSSPHVFESSQNFEFAMQFALQAQAAQHPNLDDSLFTNSLPNLEPTPLSFAAYQDMLLGELARQSMEYPTFPINDSSVTNSTQRFLQNDLLNSTNLMMGFPVIDQLPQRLTHDRKRTQSSDFTLLTGRPFRDDKSTASASFSQEDDVTESGNRSDREIKKVNLYKTELCRSWEETGYCRYGSKCQFAHSETELRQIDRHPKYKTEMCKTFWEKGTCPYGKRCCFVHTDRNLQKMQDPGPPRADHQSHMRSRSLGAREILHPLIEESESHFNPVLDLNLPPVYGSVPQYTFDCLSSMNPDGYLIRNFDHDLQEIGQLMKAVNISTSGVSTPISPISTPNRCSVPFSEIAISPPSSRMTSFSGGRSLPFDNGFDVSLDNNRHRRHHSVSYQKPTITSPNRHVSHNSELYNTFCARQALMEHFDPGFGVPFSPNEPSESSGKTIISPKSFEVESNITVTLPNKSILNEETRPQFLKSM
ncbi:hypothetical protein HK096_009142 [Nowakowskiella sp. JEL0078]|nr:hypothetical protein HK096_009142 [Nowakowskiella sp. JEL0078]